MAYRCGDRYQMDLMPQSIEAPKMHMPEMNQATRKMSFAEVELGFDREDAIKEACRCLRCDAAV